MLPSLHDNFLVSDAVNCETRQIRLWAKRDPRLPATTGEQTTRIVVFNGVAGYQFENDAFGNIIFSLKQFPLRSCSPPTVRGSQSPFAWRAPLVRGLLISRPPPGSRR
jgi:hypothetical protein